MRAVNAHNEGWKQDNCTIKTADIAYKCHESVGFTLLHPFFIRQFKCNFRELVILSIHLTSGNIFYCQEIKWFRFLREETYWIFVIIKLIGC